LSCTFNGFRIAYYLENTDEVRVWNIKNEAPEISLKEKFNAVKISPNGEYITGLDAFGTLHIYDCENLF
jgi:hypothetical protein